MVNSGLEIIIETQIPSPNRCVQRQNVAQNTVNTNGGQWSGGHCFILFPYPATSEQVSNAARICHADFESIFMIF